MVARSTERRGDWRRSRPGTLIFSSIGRPLAARIFSRLSVANLDGDELLAALQRVGAVILTPVDEKCEVAVAACYKAARHFFSNSFDDKAAHGAASGPGQLHGYMEYLDDDEGSECFEAKLHHDPRFTWPARPPVLRAAVLALQQVLLDTACQALGVLVSALQLHRERTAALLDVQRAQVDLETCSHTALRVWSYTRGRTTGVHVDNSLLTIAPAGSSIGLRVHTLDGRSCFPEAEMEPGDLFLFAGDALSYLTGGAVPALMHEVTPPTTGTAAGHKAAAPRLSAPLFLRGRRGEILRPPPPLPPLRVQDLELNPGNLRERFPWKQYGAHASYYSGGTWHQQV